MSTDLPVYPKGTDADDTTLTREADIVKDVANCDIARQFTKERTSEQLENLVDSVIFSYEGDS